MIYNYTHEQTLSVCYKQLWTLMNKLFTVGFKTGYKRVQNWWRCVELQGLFFTSWAQVWQNFLRHLLDFFWSFHQLMEFAQLSWEWSRSICIQIHTSLINIQHQSKVWTHLLIFQNEKVFIWLQLLCYIVNSLYNCCCGRNIHAT